MSAMAIFSQLAKQDSHLVRSLAMRRILKVEDVFDIAGRGLVLTPKIPDNLGFAIRPNDRTQLRTPDGRILDTYISGFASGRPRGGRRCYYIVLSCDVLKRDVPIGTEVWFDQLKSVISKTVAIFRESPDASDDDIYRKVIAASVEPKHAARLVEFLPMAYCRLILASTGTRFSVMFRRRQHDGSLSHEQTLASEPLWSEIMSFAKAEQAASKDLLAIASHSAEFDAVNQLVNRGSKPEDIALSTTVLMWPEEGPTP
jgi:hypothetical protein